MFQNILYKSTLWLSISCWIVLVGCDKNVLHLHVIDNDGMPLATWIPKGCHHSRICEFHANLLGEERSAVSVKGEHRTFHLLILCPCIHHGGVVYAVNNDIRDALGLQFSLFRKVARHLLCGSGGGEPPMTSERGTFFGGKPLSKGTFGILAPLAIADAARGALFPIAVRK
eukprot:Skav218356  [mRNA]  locus=scaffold2066:29649:30215:- [translate_table: standard]